MMEEFTVLIEEHRAMHACAGALMHLAHGGRDGIGALLHPLAWMASKVHAPKEALCLLGRLPPDAATTVAVIQLLEERTRVERQLTSLSERWDRDVFHGGDADPALVETLGSLTDVMEAEEQLLFAAVYGCSNDDDLWQIGVDLDRNVDAHGRAAREAFIQRHMVRLDAEGSGRRLAGW